MALDPVSNFAIVTVSIGYAAGATSIVLEAGQGASLPQPSTDGAFNLAWVNWTDYPGGINMSGEVDPSLEIIRVTARSTDTLTVTRAQEGTSDVNHNTGGKTYKMILSITKKTIDDIGSTFLKHSLATAANDFLVASGVGAFVKKTLAEAKTILGLTPVSFSVHRNGVDQTITTSTWTKVAWTTEDYDTNDNFAGGTFTPTIAGRYLLTTMGSYDSLVAGDIAGIAIYKNGVVLKYNLVTVGGNFDQRPLTWPVVANGSTDYFDVYTFHNHGVDRLFLGNIALSSFAGV